MSSAPAAGTPEAPALPVPRRVEALGVGFAVRTLGPEGGPAVLLLHGFPETHRSFQHVAPQLAAAGHRVFLADLKGYGDSDKPLPDLEASGERVGPGDYRVSALSLEIAALIRALGYGRMAVVGHDWGGVLTAALLVTAPDALERVAILNAPARRFVPWAPRHIYAFNVPGLPERRFWREPTAFVGGILERWTAGPSRFDPEDVRVYTRALQAGPSFRCAMAYYRSLRLDAPFLARAMWRPPTAPPPSLVLFGARDPIMPPSVAQMAHADLAGSQLVLVPDAGHFVQTDAPQVVAQHLLRFLSEGR